MITNNVEEAILLADRILPMTRGPRATLGASIPVGLARPRAADLLLHDAEAIRVRARVVEALTGTIPPALRSSSESGPRPANAECVVGIYELAESPER
jgi:nitrate/nitrite transport system ATP-binding protein